MSKLDNEQMQIAYMELRGKGTDPYEACVQLGFSDHIADSVARRMEEKYQTHLKEVLAKVQNSLAHTTKKNKKGPLDFLNTVMNDPCMPMDLRIKIGFNLLPYFAAKKSVGKPLTKKEEGNNAAESAANGSFGQSTPPKLKSVN